MAENCMKLIMIIILLSCGIQDLLRKKIYFWIIIAGAVFTGICIPFTNLHSIPDRIGGIAVGAAVVIISLATAGKIGMGDGLLLCVTGLGLGFWGNLELFAIALLLASVISIILLVFRLANRKKSIPFVPFLLTGYLFLIFTGR